MRPYKREDHEMIAKWCQVRDMDIPPIWSLPETGIIVDYVAVGFLILTSNRIGILDFFISNPLSDKKERDIALDKIATNLIELAIDMDVKVIQCDTQHPAMKERALKHGFNFLGHYSSFSKGL